MEGDNNNYNNTHEIYRECLRNHAASLGSYATDGCGEFTLDDTSPNGGLNCAACGCHRNFHRKLTHSRAHEVVVAPEIVDYGGSGMKAAMMAYSPESSEKGMSRNNKKRFRTKFSEEQKEKMMAFAEKLGWRLQRRDDGGDDEIERFCRGVGITRKVFKVWMHNHKNSTSITTTGNASSLTDDQ